MQDINMVRVFWIMSFVDNSSYLDLAFKMKIYIIKPCIMYEINARTRADGKGNKYIIVQLYNPSGRQSLNSQYRVSV